MAFKHLNNDDAFWEEEVHDANPKKKEPAILKGLPGNNFSRTALIVILLIIYFGRYVVNNFAGYGIPDSIAGFPDSIPMNALAALLIAVAVAMIVTIVFVAVFRHMRSQRKNRNNEIRNANAKAHSKAHSSHAELARLIGENPKDQWLYK